MTDRIDAIMERGRRARALLADETAMEAFAYIADKLTAEWRSTASAQALHRESLFHQIAGLDALRAQLVNWDEMARYEQAQLDKADRRATRR